MKLKVVATLCALAMGSAGTAFAASGTLSNQVSQLQAQVQKLQAQVNSMGNSGSASVAGVSVGTYSPLTWQLLDNTVGVGTEMAILKARQQNNISNQALYFGGEGKADAIYQHSNTGGVFNTASTGSSSAKNRTQLSLTQGALDVIGNMNNWATAYVQIGATNIGGSGASDNATFQKGYLLLGDLNQSPVYGLVGKKEVDFGNFSSVNMYFNPLNRVAYQATGTQAAVGYAQYGFNGTASVMNGGNNGTNLNTSNNNQVNNFALNGTYSATNNGVNWSAGAGYLNGSGFFSNSNNTTRNSAWDVNGTVGVNNFNVIAEYTGNVDSQSSGSSRPYAYDLGANYMFPVMGHNSVVSADYSQLRADDVSGNTQTFGQYVVGFRTEAMTNVWAGVEYAYNDGVYTNNIGGSSSATTGGFIGNSSAKNNTLLLDVTAMF